MIALFDCNLIQFRHRNCLHHLYDLQFKHLSIKRMQKSFAIILLIAYIQKHVSFYLLNRFYI